MTDGAALLIGHIGALATMDPALGEVRDAWILLELSVPLQETVAVARTAPPGGP